jgi:hypothetical protein
VNFGANPTVATEKAYPRPCRWQSEVLHKAIIWGETAPGPHAPQEGYWGADPEYSYTKGGLPYPGNHVGSKKSGSQLLRRDKDSILLTI